MAPPPAVEFELTEPEYVKGLQRLIRRNRSLVGLAALSPLAANRLGNIVARRAFASPDDEARFRALAGEHGLGRHASA